MNNLLSIIIPAYQEIYLRQTIESIMQSAVEPIEIIIILDGYWPKGMPIRYKPLHTVHFSTRRGMRSAINAGSRLARGKYLMKLDGHCSLDQAFDVKLKSYCDHNTVQVPVRYALDIKEWRRKGQPKEFQYIDRKTLKGHDWPEFADRVHSNSICDLMTTQGSCWFMQREFFDSIGGLDDINYGGMGREAQELCFKTWLSGGRLILNRNVWYAHWNKPKEFVVKRRSDKIKSEDFARKFWTEQKIKPVIERFAPVPTWI